MKAQRFGITIVAVAATAAVIGAGIGTARNAPPWLAALDARSDGLNRAYGLGEYGKRHTLGAPAPGWLVGLRARSEAMNRYYGLGEYARTTARANGAPDWLVALDARSEALNRHYGLGTYASGKERS